jgi:hypothetical protein
MRRPFLSIRASGPADRDCRVAALRSAPRNDKGASHTPSQRVSSSPPPTVSKSQIRSSVLGRATGPRTPLQIRSSVFSPWSWAKPTIYRSSVLGQGVKHPPVAPRRFYQSFAKRNNNLQFSIVKSPLQSPERLILLAEQRRLSEKKATLLTRRVIFL